MTRTAHKKRAFYLKERRKIAKLTQEQLADAIGTTKGVISQLESGHMRYNEGWIESTSSTLNIEPYLLFVAPDDNQNDALLMRIISSWKNLNDFQRATLASVVNGFIGDKPPEKTDG